MMKTIILHSQDLDIANKIADIIGAEFRSKVSHFAFPTDKNIDLSPLRQKFGVDINYLPKFNFSKTAIFVSDMDSTLINIESIDEIADFANLKPQVAAITKKAMQGEMDFAASLIARLSLLKGLDVAVLDKVYTQKLRLNKGVGKLIKFLHKKSVKTAVVSGGFTYFTHRLAQDIGLDHQRASELEIVNQKLSGKLVGEVVNAASKAEFVAQLCKKYKVSASQVIVAGDGANDLLMMKMAGLSVAYRAKPIVAEYADIVINHSGLDKIVDLFNY